MQKSKTKLYILYSFDVLVSCFVFFITYRLFDRFVYSKLISDFPSHIVAAINGDGYSLMHILLKGTYKLFGTYSAISVLMSLIVLLTAVFITVLIKTLYRVISNEEIADTFCPAVYAFSVSLLFIASIYFPRYWEHFYVAQTITTQPWHNSTYILMRLFAVLTLIFYFRIQDVYYNKKVGIKEYFLFFVFLFFSNFAKPNFLLAFAPVMLIVLIYDFIKTKAKSFFSALIFGICVLVSIIPVFFQTDSLYSSAEEQSSIILSSDRILDFLSDKHYIVSLGCDFFFPVVATAVILIYFVRKKDISLRPLFLSWGSFVLAVMEALFVAETGPRATHGNFSWGQYFFAFLLYLVCASYLLVLTKKNKKFYFAFLPYLLNLASGIVYFLRLLGLIKGYNDFLM